MGAVETIGRSKQNNPYFFVHFLNGYAYTLPAFYNILPPALGYYTWHFWRTTFIAATALVTVNTINILAYNCYAQLKFILPRFHQLPESANGRSKGNLVYDNHEPAYFMGTNSRKEAGLIKLLPRIWYNLLHGCSVSAATLIMFL